MPFTTIDDPTVYFQMKTYSGNGTAIGSGGNSITFDGDTDLTPGMLWIKRTDSQSAHNVHDDVRGAQNRVYPNNTDVEDTNVTESVNAFTSDGFNLGNSGQGNGDGPKHVAWCWKAGTTSGIGTSGQDITPSGYSINTTSKFGIYAYGGNGTDDQQINHGLGVAPKFIIQKARSNASQDWHVFHARNTSAPETDYLYLNETNATTDRVESWSDQLPDTTDITLGTSNDGNQSGQTFIMYAWGEVQGFSKFGAYVGNGNVDGPFLYCGFQPAWCMLKRTDGTQPWEVFDNKRSTNGGFNELDKSIAVDNANAEDTSTDYDDVDFVSNGVKIREDNDDINASGAKYIFVAFARAPFVNSNGVPCNAR